MSDDFCVLILSYQRPDRILTLDSLEKAGYTGPAYVVVDDKDPTLPEYRKRYNDKLIVFSKDEVESRVDTADLKDDQDVVVYAREAAWDIAENLGANYFMVMDDDYDWFRYRIGRKGEYLHSPPWVENLDSVFEAFVDYMDKHDRVVDLAFSQGGDWIGGPGNSAADGFTSKRKAMNAHLLKTDRRFKFRGRINEDTTAYVRNGHIGEIFLTYMPVALNQGTTQKHEGGLTDAYLDLGTYVKSFYTVLYAPSCTKVAAMGDTELRLHHRISWRNAVPKILPEKFRKT